MQIVQQLAGYSLGRADLVRRAMSKKKANVMNEERQNFVYGKKREDGSVEVPGAVSRGISPEAANEIFDRMVSFASYAFNKSHAACYALVSYRTAYLKRYYPCEFMAALLTSVIDNTDKTVEYINECTRMNIKILPPDVNSSTDRFTVENGCIRFSLAAVKNLGRGVIRKIVSEREANGRFTDFVDFCSRVYGNDDINKRVFESLIKCGACDGLAKNRKQMYTGYAGIIDSLEAVAKRNLTGQMSLFDNFETGSSSNREIIQQLADTEEFSKSELLTMEKEATGLYISGHPLAEYKNAFSRNRCKKISEINDAIFEKNTLKDGDYVNALVVVSSKRLKTTKSNSVMAFVNAEDDTSSAEILVFPKILEKYSSLLVNDAVLVMRARLSVEDENFKFIADTFTPVKSDAGTYDDGLYLKLPSKSGEKYTKTIEILKVFDGNVPVSFRYVDTGRAERSNTHKVNINDVLITQLKSVLGEENVIAFLNGKNYK